MNLKNTLVVLAFLATACCGGASAPTAPAPTPDPTGRILSFPLPGGATGKIIIKTIDPSAKTVAYSWEIPPEYEVIIAPKWVGPEPLTFGRAAWSGGEVALGGDYPPTFPPLRAPQELMGNIKELRFLLWTAPKGQRIGTPERETDGTINLQLNW